MAMIKATRNELNSTNQNKEKEMGFLLPSLSWTRKAFGRKLALHLSTLPHFPAFPSCMPNRPYTNHVSCMHPHTSSHSHPYHESYFLQKPFKLSICHYNMSYTNIILDPWSKPMGRLWLCLIHGG
jgi:hypothetical protein